MDGYQKRWFKTPPFDGKWKAEIVPQSDADVRQCQTSFLTNPFQVVVTNLQDATVG
jgi:hypothetical protein